MTLREFKEVFTSKPCDFSITIYCCIHKRKIRIIKKYYEMLSFYKDTYCDEYIVNEFRVHDGSIRDIFIAIIPEVSSNGE